MQPLLLSCVTGLKTLSIRLPCRACTAGCLPARVVRRYRGPGPCFLAFQLSPLVYGSPAEPPVRPVMPAKSVPGLPSLARPGWQGRFRGARLHAAARTARRVRGADRTPVLPPVCLAPPECDARWPSHPGGCSLCTGRSTTSSCGSPRAAHGPCALRG